MKSESVSIILPEKPSQLAIFWMQTMDWSVLTTEKVELETSFESEH